MTAGSAPHLAEHQWQAIELVKGDAIKIELHPFQSHAELVVENLGGQFLAFARGAGIDVAEAS